MMSKTNNLPDINNSKVNRRYLFLSGTIGAGKSTLLSKLKGVFANYGVSLIKEYIDYDLQGDSKLNDFLKGNISCMDFQVYVLQCYQRQIREATGNLLIFERHPMENIIFASCSLSPEQLKALWRMTKHMCELEEIPMPWNVPLHVYDTDDNGVEGVIFAHMKENEHLLCHLSVSESLQYYRLLTRGRESDLKYIQEHQQAYLKRINDIYECLLTNRYHITPAYFTIFYRRPHDPIPMLLNDEQEN